MSHRVFNKSSSLKLGNDGSLAAAVVEAVVASVVSDSDSVAVSVTSICDAKKRRKMLSLL